MLRNPETEKVTVTPVFDYHDRPYLWSDVWRGSGGGAMEGGGVISGSIAHPDVEC